jgi:hypothetical protein
MAAIGTDRYLAVHDAKGGADEPRLTRIDVTPNGFDCTAIVVNSWNDADGPGNDFESITSLPGRANEFLVSESGTWEGRFGRLFHVRLQDDRAEVLHSWRLPSFIGNRKDVDGDDYEGIAAFPRQDGTFLVLLGERGGSPAYPRGLLRWGTFDAARGTLTWADEGRRTIEITAPGAWPAGVQHRDIADLHIDADGVLWVAASAEAGKRGPFRSIVYRAGHIADDLLQPLVLEPARTAWVVDGLKVEALAAPPASIKGSALSIGSEDEHLGGVWRALFAPVN